MDIIVNGEKLELEEGVTLFALIARFGGIDKVMAAAVNMEIVKKEGWYRDWETDRKSTRLNSSHITRSRMPSSA